MSTDNVNDGPRTAGRRRSMTTRLIGVALAGAVGIGGVMVATPSAQAAGSHNVMVTTSTSKNYYQSVRLYVNGLGTKCTPLTRGVWNSTGVRVSEGAIVRPSVYSDTHCQSLRFVVGNYVVPSSSSTNWWLDLQIV